MKIRQGFVSNSSSSSYIIGIGKLIDETKFTEYCKSNHIDYEILTVKEIIEKSGWDRCYREKDKSFYNEAFDGNKVSIKIDPTKFEDKYIKVNYGEDIQEDPDGDTNYDIDCDDFEPIGQTIFGIGHNTGVQSFQYSYGAGRNG
ncbi:MAG: hypothetical protein M0R17_02880 [Candidatus Omnitrophica bacterium]|jgi:hypothetical protein|nr:hypothetical protein [Candidatus Omnitrophota bacterium]